MSKLANRREWYTLKNNKDENEIMILMSLNYDYKEDIQYNNYQLNNNSQNNINNTM